jgi:beta-ketoacyl-acyl-carrier-protein synthase II
MTRRRVVITGLGAITPIGNDVPTYWDGLLSGRSGIGKITHFDPSEFPCQIAGEVKDFDPAQYLERKEIRRVSRSAQFAIASAQQAVQDSGLPATMPDPERSGVMLGTAVGGVQRITDEIEVLKARGYARINPFAVPNGLPNAPAFLISQSFQCLGPSMTITTACSSSTQAIGEGAELIRRGKLDIVIACGTEATILDYTMGGFSVMRAVPVNFNDCPEQASRPFDIRREGFVLSEGSGTVILEELEHALARGATIYAEVMGHAASADGYHIAALEPNGSGAARAMRWAIEDAGMEIDDIDYINTHGSSTPLNDITETRAIKDVFGERAYKLAINSTKSMIGHPLGASGVLEAIASIKTIQEDHIPPTINLHEPDPECDLDYVPNTPRRAKINTALTNSFGLGGQNACLVLKKFNP